MNLPDPVEGLPLDHVAIAVESIDGVLPALQTITGAASSGRERIEAQGVELVFLGAGDGKLELLQPLGPETAVGRFLARRGPGLHHIAFRVADIDATLRDLQSAGLELIDREARPGAMGHRVAFLHPRNTGGVLVELVEQRG